MRRIKRVVAVAVLLGFAGLWAALAQSTPDLASADKVGWWTRRPGAQPADNANIFEVAAGVQGDESVAAVRILIRGEVTKATLVLAEADAPLKDIEPGKLRVCTTSTPWLLQPAIDGGPYADAPKPDCNGAVELTRTADLAGNGAWAGDITSMLAGARSEISLMVVPSPDAAAVLPATYFIKLAPRVDAEGTPDVKPALSPPPAPSPPAAANRGPVATAPSGTAAPVATSPPTTAAPSTENAAPRRFAVATSKKPGKPWGKLFLLVPLAAIGAALYTGGRKLYEQRLAEATT